MHALARTIPKHLCALFLSFLCVTTLAQSPEPKPAESKPDGPVSDGIDHITLGQSVFPLNGPYKFKIGDSPLDPATRQPLWAERGFDDSLWETVDLTPPKGPFDPSASPDYLPGWTAKGHSGYSGYAWYRIRVKVDDPDPGKLALVGPLNADDAFQVYVNGVMVGSFGDFSNSPPTAYLAHPSFFPIQSIQDRASKIPAQGVQVIAFRFWMEPSTLIGTSDVGGFHDAPQFGRADIVSVIYRDRWIKQLRDGAKQPIEILLFFLVAVLAISLSTFDRLDKVYWWIAGVYLLSAVVASEVLFASLGRYFSVLIFNIVDSLVFPLFFTLWLMVWWVWFRLKRPLWVPKLAVVLTVPFMIGMLQDEGVIFGSLPQHLLGSIHLLMFAIRLTFSALLITVVALGVRKQGREGWVVLPAVIIQGLMMFRSELVDLGVPVYWMVWGVFINLHALEELFLMIALFVLLLRRMMLSLRAQREQALDIKQAAEVQQVILPESRTVYPGLVIETEYRAARQIGGDFFQIIPHAADGSDKAGSTLIVAGDVTGKGLQAGMTVALLIGAIRSTAELNPSPLFVLEALNRRLIGRESSQATCLALSIGADGSCTLANAGHLPPYLNGKPLYMEGALPLGMIDGAEFSVMHFTLAPDDKLVMVSDGILEATNAKGELFGFERVAQLLRNNGAVKALADAAQIFGQEDDISLVSVTRTVAV